MPKTDKGKRVFFEVNNPLITDIPFNLDYRHEIEKAYPTAFFFFGKTKIKIDCLETQRNDILLFLGYKAAQRDEGR